MNRNELLNEAQRVITGERQDQYGNPENSFWIIANLWSAYLGQDITASDVALMMILLKTGRQTNQHKTDNLIDIAGYAALAAELSSSAYPKDDDDCDDIGEAYEEALKREKALIDVLEQYKCPCERLGDLGR